MDILLVLMILGAAAFCLVVIGVLNKNLPKKHRTNKIRDSIKPPD
jgi:hypothetical protein